MSDGRTLPIPQGLDAQRAAAHRQQDRRAMVMAALQGGNVPTPEDLTALETWITATAEDTKP